MHTPDEPEQLEDRRFGDGSGADDEDDPDEREPFRDLDIGDPEREVRGRA